MAVLQLKSKPRNATVVSTTFSELEMLFKVCRTMYVWHIGVVCSPACIDMYTHRMPSNV
jgi:hypothetical protein